VGDPVWDLAHVESDVLSWSDCRARVHEASRNPTGEPQWVTNVGSSARRNLPVAGLALLDKLAIEGSKDPLFPLAKPRVRFGSLHDRHRGPRLVLVIREMTKQSGERVGLQAQHALERRDPIRLGGRLAKQPLGHRRLRHADRGGQGTLRQTALLPGSLERPGKHLSLLGRRHRHGPLLGVPELPEQACLIG
jgi:hypothetical protein